MKNLYITTILILISLILYYYIGDTFYVKKSPFHPEKILTKGRADTVFAQILSLTERDNSTHFDEKGNKITNQDYHLRKARYFSYQIDCYFQDKKKYQYDALYWFYDPKFASWPDAVNYGVCVHIEFDTNDEIIKHKILFEFSGSYEELYLARDYFWKVINGEKLPKVNAKKSPFKINPKYMKQDK